MPIVGGRPDAPNKDGGRPSIGRLVIRPHNLEADRRRRAGAIGHRRRLNQAQNNGGRPDIAVPKRNWGPIGHRKSRSGPKKSEADRLPGSCRIRVAQNKGCATRMHADPVVRKTRVLRNFRVAQDSGRGRGTRVCGNCGPADHPKKKSQPAKYPTRSVSIQESTNPSLCRRAQRDMQAGI
jgi:hypothetical protein